LIPIVDRPDGLTVLLTRRSAKLKHHAGQVGFPGGRMEVRDADVLETALRETREELGIHPDQVEVAGYLVPIPTLSGYAVTPVVGLLADETPLTLDRTEVESAFEVPLGYLLDPANQRRKTGDVDRVAFPTEFHYGGQRIWGVTASILIALRDFLKSPDTDGRRSTAGSGSSTARSPRP
jgi:8-oxo-dGTP pyrophosphatase MutT (NUDIX family)